jgi:hypothetical protein
MKKIHLIFNLLLISLLSVSQNIDIKSGLIAHYPLTENAEDITGMQEKIKLQHSPSGEDGSYCSGVYNDQTTLNPDTKTAALSGFNYKNFTISVEFKVTDFRYQWVFTLGVGGRLVGYLLKDDSTIFLTGSNHRNKKLTKGKYDLNKWFLATITYNNGIAKIYLNNNIIGEDEIVFKYFDNEFTTTNFGNGIAFKGNIRNIRVYSRTLNDKEIEVLYQNNQ